MSTNPYSTLSRRHKPTPLAEAGVLANIGDASLFFKLQE